MNFLLKFAFTFTFSFFLSLSLSLSFSCLAKVSTTCPIIQNCVKWYETLNLKIKLVCTYSSEEGRGGGGVSRSIALKDNQKQKLSSKRD